MKPHLYILKGQEPVPERDVLAWGEWFEDIKNRRVAYTEIPGGYVSTVFLGLDHNFLGSGPPLLFESMLFLTDKSDERSGDCRRTSTWEDAVRAHHDLVSEFRRKRSILWKI